MGIKYSPNRGEITLWPVGETGKHDIVNGKNDIIRVDLPPGGFEPLLRTILYESGITRTIATSRIAKDIRQ